MKKIILAGLFLSGLLYIVLPGPSSINDFPAIPESLKSDEPGDTTQVPNIAAYFSDHNRQQITSFYKNEYAKNHWFGFVPPISLNYPPRAAYIYVRDLQMGTFLEEYVYPLRDSLFVNGYEPFVENEINKRNHTFFGDNIHIDGNFYASKATIRYYPTSIFVRVVVYLGIWLMVASLFRLSRRAILEG